MLGSRWFLCLSMLRLAATGRWDGDIHDALHPDDELRPGVQGAPAVDPGADTPYLVSDEEAIATQLVELPPSDLEAVHAKHPMHKFEWERVSGPQAIESCLALFVLGVLVSAAGVGGGGIYLAILMLIGGISPRDAVPLSHAIVLLGAIGSLLVNVRRWWITGICDINIDTCRMVVPAALLGTLLGFLLNTFVADMLILKLLVVILTFLVAVVLRIWWNQRCEELGVRCASDCDGETYQTQRALTRPEIAVSVLLLLVVDICSVLRFHMLACRADKRQPWGGSASGACAHPVLWTLFGSRMEVWLDDSILADRFQLTVECLPVVLCMVFASYYAQQMVVEKKWNASSVVATQAVAWSTGVMSGLVGIGGGLVFSPFFLLTMDPLIAVGTSSTCLLFTAASATVQYALTDRIIMSCAAVYGLVAFVASICGTLLVQTIRDRMPTGKSSITLIVAIAVVLTNVLILAKLWRAGFNTLLG